MYQIQKGFAGKELLIVMKMINVFLSSYELYYISTLSSSKLSFLVFELILILM